MRTKAFPAFFGWLDEHQYPRHCMLFGKARRFRIEMLVNWLEEKKYLESVEIKRPTIMGQRFEVFQGATAEVKTHLQCCWDNEKPQNEGLRTKAESKGILGSRA